MRGFRCDNLRTKRVSAQAASVVGPTVTNATLTFTAATAGGAGNALSVVCVAGTGEDSALDASIAAGVITITLGTNAEEAPDDTKNTGTLVAAAVDALEEVACTTSGTGAGVVAPFAALALVNGHDVWTISALAKAANVSDQLIKSLENGGNCEVHEAARIANALGIATSALGVAL